jgi:cell division protein FtsL
MRKRKKTTSRYIQKSNRRRSNKGILFFFLAIIMVIFYLWGKVQIDFEYRKNQSLESEKSKIEKEIYKLRTQIHVLESYQRITEQARKQGMVFLSPARIQKLYVDLEGIEHPVRFRQEKMQYASFYPNRIK